MSRRKAIDPSILEAAKQFDPSAFAEAIRGAFSDFPDPRCNEKRILYPIWYLSLIVLCGFFCGCNTISDISEYAHLQATFFESLLGKSHPIPSYGAFWWFLVKVPPAALKSCLQTWFIKLPGQLQDQLLALDGKRFKSANYLGQITHLVELFSTDDRLCLAMEKVPKKTVEKTTLPTILQQVDVTGAIISADAHFTVSHVADQIVEAKADYLLAVKANQPTMLAELDNYFDQARAMSWELEHSSHISIEKGHGRIETREIRVVKDLEWLPERFRWKGLKCIIEVKSTRENLKTGKKEESRRMYISSREASAEQFSGWIRGHWSIENHCHWVADVIFDEDAAMSNRGHSAENLGVFRRLAMNMASVVDPERGLASVRRAAAFGSGYLKGILARFFCSEVSRNFS